MGAFLMELIMNSILLATILSVSSGSVDYEPLTLFQIPTICREVGIELIAAVDENVLTESEATQIFNRCMRSQEA